MVVVAFAAAGLNQRGVTFLWWEFPSAALNTGIIPRALLYKYVLAAIAIPVWLAWVATILGLVSTAGIIPDFIAGGAVELSLSKPIGRVRLLLTKFVTALLFMFLQVGAFISAAFVVIGVRGDAWEPRLFLAIPVMVLFFSYLYAVCLLLGLLTRSAIASLLLTLLVWLGVFGINSAESIFLVLRERNAMRIEWLEPAVERLESALAEDTTAGRANPRREAALEKRREQLAEGRKNSGPIRRAHAAVLAIKTAAPKTQETADLLQRVILSAADRDRFRFSDRKSPGFDFAGDDVSVDGRELQRRVEEGQLGRSLLWVIGTSVGFETVVLALAGWVFARRDF
ncbi:MAG: hypothetical protein ACKVU4_00315 [Phycisphaerales bacterium]